MSVEVQRVSGLRDTRAFIDLPFKLHANRPLWVPPLRLERWMYLSRRMNPFFTHGRAEYFLARRDGRLVGRISAQVNDAFNEHHSERWGWFGFLEFDDDPEVLTALLDAAASWLSGQGMERMVGPASLTLNDECGVLVEGYELRPMIFQPWNPPYYDARLTQAGMTKAMDVLMWKLEVVERDKVLPVIWELAEKVQSEHGIRVRSMRRRQLRKDMDSFAEIYNAAWSENWDFVPYSKKDLDAYTMDMHLAFDKNWFMIAEREDTGEVVGIALTITDLNQVLEKMKGRLLPLGWWWFLRRRKIMTRVRVGFLGVKPEYQHTGVAAKLYEEHFDAAERTPQNGGEMGWILETNTAMNRGMEAMGGTIVKRYRVYERVL
jgi:GNAT superfamily N-acetyltransferase